MNKRCQKLFGRSVRDTMQRLARSRLSWIYILVLPSILLSWYRADAQVTMTTEATKHSTASKLPRVDVRHPDFGIGCSNAADPTGQQDSTCAIEAAIAWSIANPQGATYPDVYVPAGTYKISSALYVPCEIHFVGDGPDATILEPVNNGANGITVVPGSHAVQPNLWTCNGSLENMTIHAPGGYLYTATLVEIQNSTGYTLSRIRGSNGGGRGLALVGTTERLKVIDTEWDRFAGPWSRLETS